MTERKETLEELLAKVEVGDWQNDGGMFRAFGENWTHFFDAYNGSLDAAMDLHEAVLPDWEYGYHSMWVQVLDGTLPNFG